MPTVLLSAMSALFPGSLAAGRTDTGRLRRAGPRERSHDRAWASTRCDGLPTPLDRDDPAQRLPDRPFWRRIISAPMNMPTRAGISQPCDLPKCR